MTEGTTLASRHCFSSMVYKLTCISFLIMIKHRIIYCYLQHRLYDDKIGLIVEKMFYFKLLKSLFFLIILVNMYPNNVHLYSYVALVMH